MRSLFSHVRANAVAYLALFVALGGTSYAATRLPANSVGNRQIRNHSIDPDKFNPRFIRGEIRMWASVSASGRVVGGGRGLTVIPPKGAADAGVFTIEPRRGSSIARPRRCEPLVSVDDRSPSPGFATAEVNIAAAGESPAWQVVVQTFRAQGAQPFNLPFDLVVVC
jgi:hypothetical protein